MLLQHVYKTTDRFETCELRNLRAIALLSVKKSVHIFSHPQFMKDLRNTLQSKLESLADEGPTNTLREMYVCFLEMEGARNLKLE